jgi:hypothetical protein
VWNRRIHTQLIWRVMFVSTHPGDRLNTETVVPCSLSKCKDTNVRQTAVQRAICHAIRT